MKHTQKLMRPYALRIFMKFLLFFQFKWRSGKNTCVGGVGGRNKMTWSFYKYYEKINKEIHKLPTE